jgi:hypothetical protein
VTTSHHVIAPNSVWDRGTPTIITLQNLVGAYGSDHPSGAHVDVVDEALAEVQSKQATNWKESIGATDSDIMHGCVTAEKSGVKRTSIPICDDARINLAKGQLSSLVMKHADNLTELLGEHHITGEHYNQALQKSVRHVVVPSEIADQAMKGLKANLQKSPLANGLTFTCSSANGTPPNGNVHVALTMHRSVPAESNGKVLMLDGNTVPGPSAATDTGGSALASAMFDGVKFSKRANGGKATSAAAPEAVTVHSPPVDSGGSI